MPKRNLIWVIVVFAFFVLWANGDNPARQTQRDNYDEFEKLAIILRHVTERYVHEVDKKALFEGAARGMLAELDPYCTYIPPRLQGEFEKEVHGLFGGIGIRIGLRNNLLTVISPLEGTPAFRAGVLSGDTIIKINGRYLAIQRVMGNWNRTTIVAFRLIMAPKPRSEIPWASRR